MATTVALRSPGMATRAIHWASALLVLLAWAVGSTMEDFPRGASRDLAMQLHYSLGVLVLGFAALRVAWRAVAPPPPAEGPAWQRLAATAMHLALIGLTIGVPLSGLLDRWARGRAVTIFGGMPLPAPFPVPGGRLWGEAHEVLANLMLAAIAAHVLAALWHQFILRDRALSRMVRG
ncbi:cytochrome B [Falsiroseomonas bella]|uniref:Cytochrome B n=1 Tax=Falsiroseomonas bella TaxID=2184016 RepID=A0A317FBL4_9PROT|nr:cytochrome b/b6 domain-containing protein [Falsiroseomonas bella]PWS35883.1 cytochrome B [Falsiroseomonas bella]